MTALLEKHDGLLASGAAADDLRLWLRMLSVSMLVEKRLRAMFQAEFATTLPRFDVLAALDRAPDGLTMGGLSRQLLVSNGNVTALVQALARDGLVETVQSDTDRRASVVRLTAAGRAAFEAQAGRHHELVARMFAGLSAGEVRATHGLLGRLKQSLAESGELA